MSDETKKDKNKEMGEVKKETPPVEAKTTPTESKEKKITLGEKECTVSEFAAFSGLNRRTVYWIKKRYDLKEKRKALDWAEELISQGAINETPTILKKMVVVS